MLNLDLIKILLPYEDCIDGFNPVDLVGPHKYASSEELLLIAKRFREEDKKLCSMDQMLLDMTTMAEKLEFAAHSEAQLNTSSKQIRRTRN